MANCYLVKTLIKSRLFLPVLTKPKVDVMIYQQLIGLLMYAMVCTHPNILSSNNSPGPDWADTN